MSGSDSYSNSAPPLGFDQAWIDNQLATGSGKNLLAAQILSQGTYNQWTGEGFGTILANAQHIAQGLVDAGITRLEDFAGGTRPKMSDVQFVSRPNYVVTGMDGEGGDLYTMQGYRWQYYHVTGNDGEGGDIGEWRSPDAATLSQLGSALPPTLTGYDGEGGDITTPITKNLIAPIGTEQYFYNKATGQLVSSSFANEISGNKFGVTYAGDGSTAFNVQFTDTGMPVFTSNYNGSSSDFPDLGFILSVASIIPGPHQPFAMGFNAAYQYSNGNYIGAVLSGLGAAGAYGTALSSEIAALEKAGDSLGAAMLADSAGGFFATNLSSIRTVTQVTQALNALDKGSLAGVVNAITSLGQQAGITIPSEYMKPIMIAATASAVAQGDWTGAASIASQIGNNAALRQNTELATRAINLVKAVESGNTSAIFSSAVGFAKQADLGVASIQDMAKGFGFGLTDAEANDIFTGVTSAGDTFTSKVVPLTTEQKKELWQFLTGETATDADLVGLEGVTNSEAYEVIGNYAYTTIDEAKQFYKDVFGESYEPTDEEIMGVVGSGERMAKSYITNEYKVDQATKFVDEAFSDLPEFDKQFYAEEYQSAINAAINGDYDSVNKMLDYVDRSYTTEIEAKQMLVDAYARNGITDRTPTTEEIARLTGQNQINSYTLAQHYTDIASTTFDGSSYSTPKEAATAAVQNGYNTYLAPDGKTYTAPKPLINQISAQVQIDKAETFNEAFAIARSDLGAAQTFSWKGKSYSTNLDTEVFDGSKLGSVNDAAVQAALKGATSFIGPNGKTYKAPTEAQVLDAYTAASDKLTSLDIKPSDLKLSYASFTADELQRYSIAPPPRSLLDDFKAVAKRTGESIVDLTMGATNKGMGSFFTGVGNFATMLTVSTDPETMEVTWHVPRDNVLTRLGAAYFAIGDSYMSDTTKGQLKEISTAVANAKTPMDKVLTAVTMGLSNPIALGAWAVAELTEEAPAILLGYGLVNAAKIGITAGISVDAMFNMAEVAGPAAEAAYINAIKAGKTEQEAVRDMLKAGSGSMALTLGTSGVVDATIFKNIVSGSMAQPLASTVASTAAKGYMTEMVDEYAVNVWNGMVMNDGVMTIKIHEDAMSQAAIAALIGAHTDVSMSVMPNIGKAIADVVIGRDITGASMTLDDLRNGSKLLDSDTLDLNTVIGTTPNYSNVTLGGILTETAYSIDPILFTEGLSSNILNADFTVGQDLLGNSVTYQQALQTAADTNESYSVVYSGLLSTTADQRIDAQTDFIQNILLTQGIDVPTADLRTIIADNNISGVENLTKAADNIANDAFLDPFSYKFTEGTQLSFNGVEYTADENGVFQPPQTTEIITDTSTTGDTAEDTRIEPVLDTVAEPIEDITTDTIEDIIADSTEDTLADSNVDTTADSIVNNQPSVEENIAYLFTTERGSTYTVYGDATTIRDRSGDNHYDTTTGLQPRSTKTVFMEPSDVYRMAGVFQNTDMATELIPVFQDGQPTGRVQLVLTEAYGPRPAGTVIDEASYTTRPAVGLHPVEIYGSASSPMESGGSNVHWGSLITEVQPQNTDITTVDPVEDIINDPVEDITVDPIEDITTDPIEDITTDPVEDITTDPIEDIINDPSLDTNPDIVVSPDQDILVDPNIEVPVDQNIEVPVDQNIEVPIDQNIEVPVDQNIEVPVDQNIEVPIDQNIEVPIDQNIEVPIDQNPETPIDLNPETPIDTNPETPIDTNPETPIDTNPETPIDTNPETPIDTNPETPIDTNPETPIDTNPGTTETKIPTLKDKINQLIKDGYNPQVAAGLAELTEPIWSGTTDYLDLGTPLDVTPVTATKNAGTQKQQNTAKMSTGGYLENMLSEEMTVEELLNILR